MVLIIRKRRRKRCDIIFIPKNILYDMLERHTSRRSLASRLNTCFVTLRNNWTGRPLHRSVIKMLMTTLKLLRIEEGERRYRIPANVFPGIKCRSLNKMDRPESDPYNADFVINFTRINGRSKKVIKELGKYESMRLLTTFKVRSVFRRMCQKCGKEFVFIATHIHPAETC